MQCRQKHIVRFEYTGKLHPLAHIVLQFPQDFEGEAFLIAEIKKPLLQKGLFVKTLISAEIAAQYEQAGCGLPVSFN